MAVYAIGDVQGCYDGLSRLLDEIKFDPQQDQLWFCGDLVNRGSQSLETLRFIKSLGDNAVSVLGNHDLHLLAVYHNGDNPGSKDTFDELLRSDDCDELMLWLQHQSIVHYDSSLNALLVHAGIHPEWNLPTTLALADELQQVLRSDQAAEYFASMYGNKPNRWAVDLEGMDRWRYITNVFTRMRFLKDETTLEFKSKAHPFEHPELTPWLDLPSSLPSDLRVYFGHWSTLGVGEFDQFCSLDGGYVWHGRMVAAQVDQEKPVWYFSRAR